LIIEKIHVHLREKVQGKMEKTRKTRAFNPVYESPIQLVLAGFEHLFERELDRDNRWAILVT
jgi:hypothetical protein